MARVYIYIYIYIYNSTIEGFYVIFTLHLKPLEMLSVYN